jgi:DnaK suppressor protein
MKINLKNSTLLLEEKKAQLLKRQAQLAVEDPFADTDRLVDNAAVDAEAAEQLGHATVTALQAEIEADLTAIEMALKAIKSGTYGSCLECRQLIEVDRLAVNPTAQYCIACQQQQTQPETF